MVTLALDTTTRAGSVALADGGRVIEEAASDPERPAATRLPADLIAILERHRLALGDIGVFAVATGPGSFTGLRVGIATMQGLAFASSKPLVGISGLDALAAIARSPDVSAVATWVDAWRGEVYAALYEGATLRLAPTVDAPESVLAVIAADVEDAGMPRVRFVGDGAVTYRDLIAQRLGTRASVGNPATPLLAGTIARLAEQAVTRGERPLPHAIRPLYIRRPDAELARSRARGLARS